MATTLEDIHQDIIQTHILPRLDGQSLWTITRATASSSHLQSLCFDHKLWVDVSMSVWPSIIHPRVHEIISTFPNGYRSFFQDSFPSLFTYHPSLQKQRLTSCDHHPLPSELISLVDIRYKHSIIYSTSHFTNTKTHENHFLSSPFQILLHESTHVPKKFDVVGVTNNEAMLSLLKEFVTLNWIIINPTQKRAGNLSSIKPVSVRNGWMPNEFILQYVTVLPGCNPNEMVKCRIQLVLLVDDSQGDAVLQVKEVSLKLQDMFSRCLNGKDFMVITQRAIMEENNVRRKVIADERMFRSNYKQLKQMKRDKDELLKMKQQNSNFLLKMNYVGLLVSFCFCVYFFKSLLQ